MLKLVDLTYHSNTEFNTPLELIDAQKESLGYVNEIKRFLNVIVIKHMSAKFELYNNGVLYKFLKARNSFGYIPFKTYHYLKYINPDIILIQGFIFSLQVIFLRLYLGNKCVIILQHHGDHPYQGPRKILQKLADRFINAYIFTSLGNAGEWINEKVISGYEKCYEVLAASTSLIRQDRETSKIKCGIKGRFNFIWVGRLDSNKDPITVLSGFEKYLQVTPEAKLYMVYQADELLASVHNIISSNEKLKDAVILVGKVDHEELVYWYSASDFYISGSHHESCGFALLEAMACGCIPIVTDIPSFRKITDEGTHGFLYQAGDPDSLFDALRQLDMTTLDKTSSLVIEHFQKNLSFKSIAENLYSLCQTLTVK
jgi:glycosyltransferase involved in cell wall biosynthesis